MGKEFNYEKAKRKIKTGLIGLSKEEIKKTIEEELKKDESEIDADYVDFFTELFVLKEKEEISKKQKRNKSIKSLMILSIIVVFFASALTVSAQVFNFNIPQEIAKLINDSAQVDLNFQDSGTEDNCYIASSELIDNLAAHGISPVTIPSELSSEKCKITSIKYPDTDNSISTNAVIDFTYNGYYGDLLITQYAQDFEWNGITVITDIKTGQLIEFNGLKTLLFEKENSCTIEYKNNLTEYVIYLECDADTAVSFIYTIK